MVRKIVLAVSCLLFLSSLQSKVILWDLGGVLFHPNKLGVAREIGLQNFVSYMVLDLRNPNIERLIFNVLEYLEKPEPGVRELAGTAEGVPLPSIMCKWQAGTVVGTEIIKRAESYIDWLYQYDYFESKREMNLVKKTIKAMFDPAVLARNVYPIDEGVQLLIDCTKARNTDGTKKNKNIAFSNWDHLSFDKFHKTHNYIFTHFDHIVISGHIKLIKPRPEAYEYLLSTYNLDPRDCILIDDQAVNAEGARKKGIHTILIKNGDFKQVRAELKRLGAL
jgi:putative hydrolase of the HAD superfamily